MPCRSASSLDAAIDRSQTATGSPPAFLTYGRCELAMTPQPMIATRSLPSAPLLVLMVDVLLRAARAYSAIGVASRQISPAGAALTNEHALTALASVARSPCSPIGKRTI